MKYLGKRKILELAKVVGKYDIMPRCVDCHYSFNSGYEWLKFWTPDYSKRIVFTVYKCGVYVRVEEFTEDNEQVRNEFVSNLTLAMRGIAIS